MWLFNMKILILTSYVIDILLFTLVVLSNQIITFISLLTQIRKHYNNSQITLYQVSIDHRSMNIEQMYKY
jgi:hypothetical protein